MSSRLISTISIWTLLLVGCSNSDPSVGQNDLGPVTSLSETRPPESPSSRVVDRLRFTFESLPLGGLPIGSVISDQSESNNNGIIAASSESEVPDLQVVPGKGGVTQALAFAEPCEDTLSCRRAIIEVADDPSLNPGDDDFSFGAVLRMPLAQVGANVIQKGYSTAGTSQWKLQIDGMAGNPSCVLVWDGGSGVQKVVSPQSVTDGGWHTIDCERMANDLTISVDGHETSAEQAPGLLDFDNSSPVRIGGKNTKSNSDPFIGEIDEVYFRLPPR